MTAVKMMILIAVKSIFITYENTNQFHFESNGDFRGNIVTSFFFSKNNIEQTIAKSVFKSWQLKIKY